MRRCGVAPGEPALALAREIERVTRTCASPACRPTTAARSTCAQWRERRARIIEGRRSSAHDDEGAARGGRASTARSSPARAAAPSCSRSSPGAWDEIQPGSYVFMDADYARNEWAAPLPRFEHALFVLATVMSRPAPSGSRSSTPGSRRRASTRACRRSGSAPGLTYTRASDEHGVIEVAREAHAGARREAAARSRATAIRRSISTTGTSASGETSSRRSGRLLPGARCTNADGIPRETTRGLAGP